MTAGVGYNQDGPSFMIPMFIDMYIDDAADVGVNSVETDGQWMYERANTFWHCVYASGTRN